MRDAAAGLVRVERQPCGAPTWWVMVRVGALWLPHDYHRSRRAAGVSACSIRRMIRDVAANERAAARAAEEAR